MTLKNSVLVRSIFFNNIFIKRAIDYLLSAIILFLSFPLIIAIAIAIKIVSPGSVFFDKNVLVSQAKYRIHQISYYVYGCQSQIGLWQCI